MRILLQAKQRLQSFNSSGRSAEETIRRATTSGGMIKCRDFDVGLTTTLLKYPGEIPYSYMVVGPAGGTFLGDKASILQNLPRLRSKKTEW